MKIRHSVFLMIAGATLGGISCSPDLNVAGKTDAVVNQIFHGQPKTLHTATYPAHSNAGEWFRDTTDTMGVISVSEFDPTGFLTTVTRFDPRFGVSAGTYRYFPGSNRRVSAEWTLDSVLERQEAFVYDKDGHLIELDACYPNGTQRNRMEYVVNSDGNDQELKIYDGNDVLTMREVYAYNRDGEQTEVQMYFYGGPEPKGSTMRYTYQGNGLKATMTTLNEMSDPKETRTIYTYEYDSRGNWVRRVAYNETIKAATITERTIEYYD